MSARRAPRAVDALLTALPALVLVVGKGGVGKTTCAAGLAARSAARGTPTLLVATDPAGALGAAIGVPLVAGGTTAVTGHDGLRVRQIDAAIERAAFLARWRDTLVRIVDRGTYLDVEDVAGLVDAALPGADEIFALLALADAVAEVGTAGEPASSRVVVDTAPTGHTLRLLALPDAFGALVALLDAMQEKHRFMVRSLTHRYRTDDADDFLATMRSRLEALSGALTDPGRVAAVLVTRPERVVVEETRRYSDALAGLGIAVDAVIVNDVGAPGGGADEATAMDALATTAPRAPHFVIAHVSPPPMGLAAIADLIARLERSGGKALGKAENRLPGRGTTTVSLLSGGAPRVANAADAPLVPALRLLRDLTITGGKGGVGKTTVSCALALAAARDLSTLPAAGGRVLLVSTDPAPSVADALGVGDAHWAADGPRVVPGVDALDAWQMDASAAFAAFRDRYASRIDAIFDALMGRGLDAAHDRTILRQLLALAPPGIDELYALASLGETLDDGRYARIVVDPAPTGHLLRLLELPALAVEWSHRLMRLMLKYKEVAPLGDTAAELTLFARRTRALETLLRNPARAAVVLVTLDEPLVIEESRRLAAALSARGIAIAGVLWNRAHSGAVRTPLLSDAAALPEIVAPSAREPLVGIDAVERWMRAWRAPSGVHWLGAR